MIKYGISENFIFDFFLWIGDVRYACIFSGGHTWNTICSMIVILIYRSHCLCQDKSFSLSMEDLERRFMVLSEGNTWMIVLPPHHPHALSPITPHSVKSPNSLDSTNPTSFDLPLSFSCFSCLIFFNFSLGVVHILRNHYLGSRETPSPPCNFVIIWLYTPM